MTVKTSQEIKKMRAGGKILRETLKELVAATQPGTPCAKINQLAGKLVQKAGAKPSFLGHDDFPANLCISLNEEIVHGIPGKKIIRKGDLVSYDLGVKYKGLYTDAALTFGVGKVSPSQKKIIKVCRKCLALGIKQAKAGNCLGDIGAAIQEHAEKNNFSVIRKLVGHGVGYAVHEEPSVPNYGEKGTGEKLKKGVCLAIEPMIAQGSFDIKLAPNQFAFVTKDGKLSCHFEHTIVVGKKEGEILT